ncbi:MAG: hypothetical protein ACYTGC_14130 [Planctomycetota bacterium]|jgi:hypothetical protein
MRGKKMKSVSRAISKTVLRHGLNEVAGGARRKKATAKKATYRLSNDRYQISL